MVLFALLCKKKTPRHSLSRLDAKLKPFSRALGGLVVFTLSSLGPLGYFPFFGFPAVISLNLVLRHSMEKRCKSWKSLRATP